MLYITILTADGNFPRHHHVYELHDGIGKLPDATPLLHSKK